MGEAASKLELSAEEKSDIDTSRRCIKSAPLSSLQPPILAQDFLKEAEICSRTPLLAYRYFGDVLKYFHVTQHGPSDHSIKIVLDGKKLDLAGKGRGDGVDKVVAWKRQRSDFDAMFAVIWHYVDFIGGGCWEDEVPPAMAAEAAKTEVPGPRLEVPLKITLHASHPSGRLEFFVDHNGRPSSSDLMAMVVNQSVDVIVKHRQQVSENGVFVHEGQDSIKDEGAQSNVSDIIEGVDIDYEDLFDTMVLVLKSSMRRLKCTEASEHEFTGEGGINLAEVFAGPVDGIAPSLNAKAEEEKEVTQHCRTTVTVNKETGCIDLVDVAVAADGSALEQPWSRETHCVLHRDPFRVEAWGINSLGERTANLPEARRIQNWINSAMRINDLGPFKYFCVDG